MNTTLNATARPESGKGAARKTRAAGKLPAVIYAQGNEATPISIDPVELDTIFRKSRNRNTIVNVELDGKTIDCIVRDAQRHPLYRDILHVDFYALEKDQVIEVDVPVEPVGRPAGASLGGRLRVVARTLHLKCKYTDIPETVKVDVSHMHIGDIIRASEITAPDGTELIYKNDFNVLNVYGKKGGGKKKKDEEEKAQA